MKEIVVISGKGGTGKTSLTAAFASLAGENIVCEADVDAADLHLLLHPVVEKEEIFYAGFLAEIDSGLCSSCGECVTNCQFSAISDSFQVDTLKCEGCGVCFDHCPENAILFPERNCGQWFVSKTAVGPMVHAKLGIAQENSGRLVSLIRQEAREIADGMGVELLITDGPPGIGCPVIASITGASFLVVVVEPTVSGVHDMKRVLKLADHFSIPACICINKFDLNLNASAEIEHIAERYGMQVVGRIPFDKKFTEAMVEGEDILKFSSQSVTAKAVSTAWNNITGLVDKINQPIKMAVL